MAWATTPGFYGKLPSLGDFVTRRLPRSFLDAWDQWLQASVATSKEQLGDQWLNTYLTSPLWRFVIAPGICGDRPCAGVLMPSVDRVGRYFPLAIVHALPRDVSLFRFASNAEDWYAQAEAVILSSLDDQNFSLNEFDQRVEQTLGSFPNVEQIYTDLVSTPSAEYLPAWCIPRKENQPLNALYAGLLGQLATKQLGAYSLWWSAGSEQVAPIFLACSGLPPAHGFQALLSGAWSEAVWGHWHLLSTLQEQDPTQLAE